MKSIAIIGSHGQLASEIKEKVKQNANYQFFGREDFPLNKSEVFLPKLDEFKPEIIINCGAYTQVDKAEDEVALAYAINEKGPAHLAHWAKKNGALFIHISTDFVFDGQQSIAYKETDPTNPQSIYGLSKRKGEEAIIDANGDYIIIRTSWLYSSYGHNFVKTMLRLGKERESLQVVDDQIGCPTYAHDLADFILSNLENFPKNGDIYHFSNRGVASWYDFACEIMKLAHLTCDVEPITTEGYPTPANRPKYSVLDTAKISEQFGYTPPIWTESLALCIEKLSSQ